MRAPDELLDLKGLGLKYCCGFLYCARKGEPIKEKVANGIAYPISLRQRPPTVAGCGGTTHRAELEMTAVPSTSTPPSGTKWRAVSSFRVIKKTRVRERWCLGGGGELARGCSLRRLCLLGILQTPEMASALTTGGKL